MELDLRGRRVLVTGGSKGIGLACAAAFAAEGCDVVLAARDAAALEAAAADLRARHQVGVATHAADLAAAAARERLAEAHPEVDVLVNNAGAIPGGSLAEIPIARWEEAWRLKVLGYVHLTQLHLARMEARGAGVVLNVIGMAGRVPRADYVCGAAGNAALIAFTQAVGARSVDRGVRVLGINPAATRTDRIVTLARSRARTRFGDEARWEETLHGLPLGRPAEPREIADLAVFLASPRAGYLSGTVVDVDAGGMFRGG
jgi:NAD(P)-dependent dehydrogenase (short-subunit alcohol dehydrogenase family)